MIGTAGGLLRVAFFGMRCAFSVPPLSALLAAGVDVVAVVLPGVPGGPPLLRRPPSFGPRLPIVPQEREPAAVDDIARRAGIPVLAVGNLRHPLVAATIADLRPDAIAVACFPRRLPPALLAVPPLGALNVHPSLLPLGRGPEPVFWTLRRGERETGATIHLMDEGLDRGPILRQERLAVPAGVRAPDLEQHLAGLGASLLVEALNDLASGRATPVPQDDARATEAPVPTAADFAVPTDLPARWAFNFVRGVAPLDGPLELLVLETGDRFPLRDALDDDPTAALGAPFVVAGNRITARFRPGVARFVLRDQPDERA